MKAALLTVIALLLAADAVAYFEVQRWVREEQNASFHEGMHFGMDEGIRQYRQMPGCDMQTCDSVIAGLQREDEDWVEYMLESCDLDNIECRRLGGCEPVMRDLSPWQETYVRTREGEMHADPDDLRADARPRAHLPDER